MVPAAGLGEGHDAVLEVPAEQDLRRRLVVSLRDRRQRRVVQPPHPGERAVGLQNDGVLVGVVQHCPAVAERAPFDLVHDRAFARHLGQRIDRRRGIVADADVDGKAVLPRADQPFPKVLADAVLRRPVDEDEVVVVEAELVEVAADRLVGVVCLLHLGGEIEVGSCEAAPADAVADPLLGAVVARRVDEAIAGLQRRQHDVRGVPRQPPRPQPHGRHGAAGVQDSPVDAVHGETFRRG